MSESREAKSLSAEEKAHNLAKQLKNDGSDPYGALEVEKGASLEEIKRSYRRLANKYHPDRGNAGDGEKFKAASTAYDLLSDPKARAYYDASQPREEPRPAQGQQQETSVNYSYQGPFEEAFQRLFGRFSTRFPDEDLRRGVHTSRSGFPQQTGSAGRPPPSSRVRHGPTDGKRASATGPGQRNPDSTRYKAVLADGNDYREIMSLVRYVGFLDPELRTPVREQSLQDLNQSFALGRIIAVHDIKRHGSPIVATAGFEDVPPDGRTVRLVNFAVHPGYQGNHELAAITAQGAANLYTDWRQQYGAGLKEPESLEFKPWGDSPSYGAYMGHFLGHIGARQALPSDTHYSVPFEQFAKVGYQRGPTQSYGPGYPGHPHSGPGPGFHGHRPGQGYGFDR